jgi:hypothetical protein
MNAPPSTRKQNAAAKQEPTASPDPLRVILDNAIRAADDNGDAAVSKWLTALRDHGTEAEGGAK